MSSARLSLRSLDALRGFLAVYVLLGHCRWLLWAGHAEWMRRPHEWWEIPIGFGSAAFRYGGFDIDQERCDAGSTEQRTEWERAGRFAVAVPP